MNWSDRFIGIPFIEFGRSRAGCDCWGLACTIYAEELGISLPQYLGDYTSAEERREISALIDGAAVSPLWLPVTGEASAFDIAVFRRGRLSSHLGIVVRPGLMIHMEGEDCAAAIPRRLYLGRGAPRDLGADRWRGGIATLGAGHRRSAGL